MNTSPTVLLALAGLALSSVATLHAQSGGKDPFLKENAPPLDPPATAGKDRVGTLMISMETYSAPAVEVDRLMSAGLNAAELRAGLIELEKAGKGQLRWVGALPSGSGQRAKIESTDEVFYIEPGASDVMEVKSRVCGDTLEIDPVISADEQLLDMNLRLTDASFAGFRPAGERLTPPVVPVIETGEITTSSVSTINEPKLIGTFTRKTPEGLHTVVALARGRIAQRIPEAAKGVPPDAGPGTWQMVFRVYEMERGLARDLIADSIVGDVLHQAVTEKVAAGQAALAQMSVVISKSGQRAKTEGEREDAFQSPGIPGKERPRFEKAGLGWVVEVDPVIHKDGQHVHLNYAASDSRFRSILAGDPALKGVPPTPIYSTSSISTQIVVQMGHFAFGGTFNQPRDSGVLERSDDGKTRLLFVEARTQ